MRKVCGIELVEVGPLGHCMSFASGSLVTTGLLVQQEGLAGPWPPSLHMQDDPSDSADKRPLKERRDMDQGVMAAPGDINSGCLTSRPCRRQQVRQVIDQRMASVSGKATSPRSMGIKRAERRKQPDGQVDPNHLIYQ